MEDEKFIYFPNEKKYKLYETDNDETLRAKRYLISKEQKGFEKFKFLKKNEKQLDLSGSLYLRMPKTTKTLSGNTYNKNIFKDNYDLKWFEEQFGTNNILKQFNEKKPYINLSNKEFFVLSYLYYVFSNLSNMDWFDNPRNNMTKISIEKQLDKTYAQLEKYLLKLIKLLQNSLDGNGYQENIDYINEMITIFKSFPDDFYPEKNYIKIPFNSDDETEKMIEKYYKYMDSSNKHVAILKPSYSDLSTGENHLVSIMSGIESSINELKRESKSVIELKKVYILMDEPDTYLHPEWSRLFIDLLLSYFKTLKDITFSVILTTNSPFMLSDVPAYNIQKISRDNNMFSVKQSEYGFGSNILDILGDSFFLKNLFGQFSTSKIELIFREIDELEKIDKLKIKQIEEIINIIGDRIIKETLQKNLSDKIYHIERKYNVEYGNEKLSKKEINNRIKELQRMLKDKHD